MTDYSDVPDNVVLIPCQPWGSEGTQPLHPSDCPYGGEVSCVSGSGGSICGGYMGGTNEYTFCHIEFREAEERWKVTNPK